MRISSKQLQKPNQVLEEGVQSLLASALAFSLMSVCVKHLSNQIPVSEIVLARALISLLITGLMLKEKRISPWGGDKKLLLIRGLLGTMALFCVFKGIKLLTLGTSTIIHYTYPTFTALFAYIFLKESLRLRIILAIIIGWIGISFIVSAEGINSNQIEHSMFSVYIALIGAILTALAYVCVRHLSKKEDPLVIVFYFPLVSFVFTFPFVIFNGVMPIGEDWLLLAGIGIFTQLGQIWITKGLSLLPAAKASAINYTQVMFGILWGILFFNERLTIKIITGACLIFIATLISISSRKYIAN